MTLIKCKECQKEISSEAKFCVHCGCPLKKVSSSDNFSEDKLNDEKNKLQSFYDENKEELKSHLWLFVIIVVISFIFIKFIPIYKDDLDRFYENSDLLQSLEKNLKN